MQQEHLTNPKELQKPSTAQFLAQQLESHIKQGKFRSHLPGYRSLAEQFSVGKNTCVEALKILESKGIIGSAIRGQNRLILQAPVNAQLKTVKMVLLVIDKTLTSGENGKWLYEQVRLYLEKSNYPYLEKDVAMQETRNPASLINKWIATYKPDCIISFSTPGPWVEMFHHSLVPTFHIGGILPESEEYSAWAPSYDTTMEMALDFLKSRGHYKILVPTDVKSHRQQSIAASKFSKCFAHLLSKQEIGNLLPIFSNTTTEERFKDWRKHLVSTQPTAVICRSSHMLISLFGFCNSQGIRIPRDLSVISCSKSESINWLHPQLSCLEFNYSNALALLEKWFNHELTSIGVHRPKPTLLTGKTVKLIK